VDVAERRAGLPRGGRLHILRHTLCSPLASRNVRAITIQHLAGHAGLERTQRYLHLGEAAPKAGIGTVGPRGTRAAQSGSGDVTSSDVA